MAAQAPKYRAARPVATARSASRAASSQASARNWRIPRRRPGRRDSGWHRLHRTHDKGEAGRRLRRGSLDNGTAVAVVEQGWGRLLDPIEPLTDDLEDTSIQDLFILLTWTS